MKSSTNIESCGFCWKPITAISDPETFIIENPDSKGSIAIIPNPQGVVNLAQRKLISNLEEVKARGGTLYVCADPSVNMDVKSGKLIHMPECDFFISPIIYNIPLQILSYEVALLRGTDIDQPRNLAKSVTVE